jgi:hypothetical protein
VVRGRSADLAPTAYEMGLEFTADGLWYSLVEAQDGSLSRSMLGSGTFSFIGPEPSAIQLLAQGVAVSAQVVFTRNPTGLWLAEESTSGTLTDGGSGYKPLYTYLYRSRVRERLGSRGSAESTYGRGSAPIMPLPSVQ